MSVLEWAPQLAIAVFTGGAAIAAANAARASRSTVEGLRQEARLREHDRRVAILRELLEVVAEMHRLTPDPANFPAEGSWQDLHSWAGAPQYMDWREEQTRLRTALLLLPDWHIESAETLSVWDDVDRENVAGLYELVSDSPRRSSSRSQRCDPEAGRVRRNG